MYHPLLLQPEVLRELPELAADLRPRRAELPQAPSYRSEAFAEDLPVPEAPAPVAGAGRGRSLLLLGLAVPAGAALLGVAAVVAGIA